jgi:type IX secretion system PorP/SprF family membrane protein
MKRLLLRIAGYAGLLFAAVQPLCAQDVHLSQFYETPLMRNPALAGIFTGDIRIQAAYRNQWQSTGVPYKTTVLSGEFKFGVGQGNDFLTVGFNMFHDIAGSSRLKTTQFMPAINFHKSLDAERNRYLSLGFMGGIVQRQFDSKNLTFDNQYTLRGYDPFAPTGEQFSGLQRTIADFAVGLSYNSQLGEYGNYFLGASLWHFNKPTERFVLEEVQLAPKWQFNGGIRTPVSETVEIHAEVNYLLQDSYTELLAGGYASYVFSDATDRDNGMQRMAVSLGAFVRLNDAVIPVARMEYNNFALGFSYDINTSQLRTASQGRGGYELTMSYRGFTHGDNSTLDAVRCPRF